MKSKNKKALTRQGIMSALKEHADILRKYKVKRMGLFGSYVRGDQKGCSDIDFLVEFDETAFNSNSNFNGYFDNYIDLLFSLEGIFGKKIDLLTIEDISPYIKPYVLIERILSKVENANEDPQGQER